MADSSDVINQNQVAQDSDFWVKWRTYQIYDVLIHVYGCKFVFESKNPDPFQSNIETEVTFNIPSKKDFVKLRSNSSKKTLFPRWNQTFCANFMDFSDTFELDINITKSFLRTHTSAAHFSFSIRDVASLDPSELAFKEFRFSSPEVNLNGCMYVGFDINPICPLIDSSFKRIHCEEILSPRTCCSSFSPSSSPTLSPSAFSEKNRYKKHATQPAMLLTDLEHCSLLLDYPTVELYPEMVEVHEVQSPLDLQSVAKI